MIPLSLDEQKELLAERDEAVENWKDMLHKYSLMLDERDEARRWARHLRVKLVEGVGWARWWQQKYDNAMLLLQIAHKDQDKVQEINEKLRAENGALRRELEALKKRDADDQ